MNYSCTTTLYDFETVRRKRGETDRIQNGSRRVTRDVAKNNQVSVVTGRRDVRTRQLIKQDPSRYT